MNPRALADTLFLMLLRHRGRHAAVFALSVLVVGLAAAVLFLTGAVQRDLDSTLDEQADLVVQRMRGGRAVDIPVEWADEFAAIPAVGAAVPRVFGRYFHEPNGIWFTVVGVDPFEEATSERLGRLIEGLDVRAFLAGESMIVGPRVRRFLAGEELKPDYVVSSPAVRARQTVVAVCAELGIGEDEIHWDERIYHASTGALMDVLSETPGTARRVLIAGHNPGLEMLVRTLSRESVPTPDDWKLMPTAAVAHFEIPGRWQDLDGGTAHLLGLTRAKSLRD